MIGRQEHQGVVRESILLESVQHGADPLVERPRTGPERRHVPARLCVVRDVLGGAGVQDVADGGRLEEFPVRLEEADGEEERSTLLGPHGEQLRGPRSDLTHPRRVEVDDVVVPEVSRIRRDVLFAHQAGPVAGVAQHIDDVALRMVQPVAAVRETEHPRCVGALAREQCGSRARTDRRSAEGLAEEHALVGHVLDVWRRDGIPVGLHVAARVVRMQIKDVRSHPPPF